MADRSNTRNSHDVESRLSRRELIKRGLALGTVGYVAPMVIGSVTPVSAQLVTGFGCTTTFASCDSEPPASAFCDDEIPCLCAPTVAGPPACVAFFPDGCPSDVCDDEGCPTQSCDTDADCDTGSVCLTLEDVANCDVADCPGLGSEFQFCLPLCSTVLNFTGQRNRSAWPAFGSLR